MQHATQMLDYICIVPTGWKDRVWHLEFISFPSLLNVILIFLKMSTVESENFLSSLSYIRRTYLKLPILFYHERPKHRNILADHWIILFPTLWNIQHSHLSRTVKIFKIIFKAVLGPYKCSWCTSGSLSWTDVRTSSKVPGGWSAFSNQAAILGSRRRHLRQTAE